MIKIRRWSTEESHSYLGYFRQGWKGAKFNNFPAKFLGMNDNEFQSVIINSYKMYPKRDETGGTLNKNCHSPEKHKTALFEK